MEDLWSLDKIHFYFSPSKPSNLTIIEEIVFRSINWYLRCPGHVALPGGMLSSKDINAAKDDALICTNLLLEYWHASRTLPCKEYFSVSGTVHPSEKVARTYDIAPPLTTGEN